MKNFYGEDGIDKYIRRVFYPDYQYAGTFVEVGAAGPEFLSMSLHFRESGWKVIAIEPNPIFCEAQRKKGHEVLQYACGEHDEDNVDFEIVFQPAEYEGGTISYESFSALKVTDEYRKHNPNIKTEKIKVNLRKLNTVLAKHAPEVKKIDVLSVDVEGWELHVLNGLDFQRYTPKVCVIENFLNTSSYRKHMLSLDYILLAKKHPNEIYIRKSDLTPLLFIRAKFFRLFW